MKAYWLVPATLALALGIALADRSSGLANCFRLRSALALAQARIAALQDENSRLGDEIRALENDPFAIERAIREDLGLARPGEIIVRFEGPEDLGRMH